MAAKIIIEDLRLTQETIAELTAIAKLAGYSINTVINIVLAQSIREAQKRSANNDD